VAVALDRMVERFTALYQESWQELVDAMLSAPQ
jgi:hypothetical protein